MSLITETPPVDPAPQAAPPADDPPKGDPPADDPKGGDDDPAPGDEPKDGDDPKPKDGDEPSDEPGEPEGKKDPEGPPEKYDLGLSEDAPVDATLLTEAETVFREIGLTNEQAQKVAALMPRAHELTLDAWKETTDGWRAETKERFGDKLEPVLARANRWVAEFGTPKLAELLDRFDIGSQPDLIEAIDKTMRAMGEDNTPPAPPGKRGSESDKLRKRYPSMFKES